MFFKFSIDFSQNQTQYFAITPRLLLDGDDNDGERKQSTRDLAGRRKTIANLEKQRFKKKEVDNLEMNFKRNFRSFAISKDYTHTLQTWMTNSQDVI